MVHTLSNEPSSRLLKHVVRCYLRLSDNPRYMTGEEAQLRSNVGYSVLYKMVLSTLSLTILVGEYLVI